MADTFVERLTGQASAEAVPVEVNLVMNDSTLLSDDASPAHLEGYGPVPAPLARIWLRDLPEDVDCWLRRLYTDPATARLVALESTRRLFTGLLRCFLVLRDQTCRTPWCDAPVRHGDHVRSAADGGPTSAENGQGLCESCNHAKQGIGWTATGREEGGVVTRTPTGHRYLSLTSDAGTGPAARSAALLSGDRLPRPRSDRLTG